MKIFILHDPFRNFPCKVVCNRNVDVVGGDRKALNDQGLDQQAGDNIARGRCGLKIAMKICKEFLRKYHIRRHAEVFSTGFKAFHVLELHFGKLDQFTRIIWHQSCQLIVVRVCLIFTLNDDRINATVGVLVDVTFVIQCGYHFKLRHISVVSSS